MVKGNYYGVLGVSPEASEEEIKNRFNELSLTAHPDKGGDEEKYKEIQNVYKVLGSPHQRLKYDLCLLKNSDYEYIESEKWGTTYRSDETISDELF